MRRARPILAALLLLVALAPAASAHETGEVDHRDTPADLAGADIERTLALSAVAGHISPDMPQFLPTTWCGTRLTGDDTVHAAFPASQKQIKVVYAYGSDAPDNSAQWRDALQANVSRIEQFLTLQTGGRRALRFDMGTVCGPQYVDIQVVPLQNPRSFYLDDFYAVADEVRAATGDDSRNLFILADDLTDGTTGVYGTGEVIPTDDRPDAGNPHNLGQLTGIMWAPAGTQPDPSGWQPTVMLHEISHNLGAVQWSAPHTTHPPNDLSGTYAHCWDGEDVMCYEDGPAMVHPYVSTVCPLGNGPIPQTYDCGRDDYFNPDPAAGSYLATHWNVYNSAFMGSCTQLGMACGDAVVPSPPVNTTLPTVSGEMRPGAVLTASAGAWLNSPTAFLIQWQRAAGGDWATIPGAVGPSYLTVPADAGAALRVVVTATNEDGSAIVASAPTAVLAAPAPPPTTAPNVKLSILLRDRARHAKGTLAARVVAVAAGREVRTDSVKVAVTPGTWRLRLCAGPNKRTLRCALSKRVRTRAHSVRLPGTKVLVRSPSGPLKVTAALVDKRQRIRAQGSAAST
ncbi:MAG TPA: hypothetical protein VF024_01485 [Solirubrobacteraceae bacterium]